MHHERPVAEPPIDAPPGRPESAWTLLDALWDAPFGIALLDRHLRFLRVNRTLSRMHGLPAEEHVGRAIEEVVPGAPLWISDELRRVVESGQPVVGLAVAGELPGSFERRHWLASYYPVRTASGLVVGVGALVVDITERRRIEEAAERAQSEAERSAQALLRLQAVTAALSAALTPVEVARVILEQGVGLLDASAGSVSVVIGEDELEILDAFGYPEKALVAWRRYSVDLPAPLSEAFRRGEPVWIAGPEEFAARYPHLRDASRAFDRGASAAVPLALGDRRVGVLGLSFSEPRHFDPAERSFILALSHQCAQALERARLYDEQHRLRDAAERAAALLDTLFSGAPVGLAFLDWHLRFMLVNAAVARMHGIAPENHTGKKLVELLPGRSSESLQAAWRRSLETGVPDTGFEVEGARAGSGQWVMSWFPVHVGGDTIGLGLVAREVTAERRADEFRHRLLGVVGHDLRNPLAAITGYARVLAKAPHLDDGQRRRVVAGIERSAGRMEEMLRDVLDYSRARVGQGIRVAPRPARIDEIAAAVVEEVLAAHPGREIRTGGRGDPALECDPDRVAQVLTNLLVNALKYGRPDRPVAIDWAGLPEHVEVRIRNEGTPIPREALADIFEPFRQYGTREARAGGLGLGLYIAREIAHAHRGAIDVASSAERGTVFTLRLPRSGPAAETRDVSAPAR